MKNQTKTNKKTKMLFCILITACCLLPCRAFAQGGTTGPLTWNISGNTLTISGNGAMPDYDNDNDDFAPWYPYRTSISSIVIEDGVSCIGNWAFAAMWNGYYNVTSVIIPNSVTRIGDVAFYWCKSLPSITLPNNLTSIGIAAFSVCYSLSSIIIPDKVTIIEARTFASCGLVSITIPNNVTSIGEEAFVGCGYLTSITLPDNLESIEYGTFSSCISLDSITIPNNVTSIGELAFFDCYSLSSITIPNKVTSIGKKAFLRCENLTSINIHALTPPVLDENVFQYVPQNIPVYIPCSSYREYISVLEWLYFNNFIVPGSKTISYTAKCYLPYSDNYFTNLNAAGTHETVKIIDGCESFITLTLIEKPVVQICMVSVDESYHNEIVWKKQENVLSYNIYREGAQSGQYDLMATVEADSPNKWVDMESNAKIRSYRYKISGLDTCGKSAASNITHKTMHLTINAGQNNSWNLIWTPYEGTTYSTYNIYRASGETMGEMQLIGTMPAGNTSFSDFGAPAGYVYYVVEIMLNENCETGKAKSSIKSNMATNNPGVGIVEMHNCASLQVYPNPTTRTLTITNYESCPELNSGTNVEVFDIYGRKQQVESKRQNGEAAEEIVMDISNLAAGIYFLKVGNETVKVVKQ